MFSAKPFFRSLRVKFSLLILLILLVVFSLSFGVLTLRSLDNQRKNLVSQARAFAELSAKPIGNTYSVYYDSGFFKFKELITEILDLNSDIEKVQIVSVNGDILFDSFYLEAGKTSPDQLIRDKNLLDLVKSNEGGEIYLGEKAEQPTEIITPYFEDFGAHPFSVRYVVSYDSISENLASTVVTTLFLSLIFFSGAIVLIVLIVDRIILNPIESVVEGAKKISTGDLSHEIRVGTRDEVEDMAAAVNQMAQTLRKNIEDLKELDKMKDEFVFLASHNLRTPLTVIKGYLSLLSEDKKLSPSVHDQIAKISGSTKELEKITETLLSLVSLEKGKEQVSTTSIDLGSLLEKVSQDLGTKAAENKISIVLEVPSQPLPKLELNKERIAQAFTGLVDNAIKFNKEGGRVLIKLTKKDDSALVSIADTGIGVSKEEIDKVFSKFHRATDVLTYNYVGIGLGLYLSKLIIEAHRGRIWFESEVGKGSTFYVSLPFISPGEPSEG